MALKNWQKILVVAVAGLSLLFLAGPVQARVSLTDLQNQINDLADEQDAEKAYRVPVGAVIAWSGSINGSGHPIIDGVVDENWVICDGRSGFAITIPDLRNRFIVGAGGSYPADASGGNNSVALSTSHLPSHRHYYSGNTNYTGSGTAFSIMPPYYALTYIIFVGP